MSFGLLFLGVALGVSGINAAIDNQKMKNYSYKIDEKGRPTWIDRKGNKYINGEKIVPKYNYQKNCMQDVGVVSGKVYFDEQESKKKRFEDWNEHLRKKAIEEKRLTYKKYDINRKRNFDCETSSGKYLAYLEGRKDGTYWKYYLSPNRNFENRPYTKTSIDDSDGCPVKISREEFDKLKLFDNSNLYRFVDYTRDSHGNFYPLGYWEKIEHDRVCRVKSLEIQKRREERLKRWKDEEEKNALEKRKEERLQEDIRLHQLYGNVDN